MGRQYLFISYGRFLLVTSCFGRVRSADMMAACELGTIIRLIGIIEMAPASIIIVLPMASLIRIYVYYTST